MEMEQPSTMFIVTSGMNVSEKTKRFLEKLKDQHKVKFQNGINDATTHVVMNTEPASSRVCVPTLKFFIGISRGLWLMNSKWLIDCVKAKRMIPEEDYEIRGDTSISATHEGPRKARTSLLPLFRGYTFILLNFKRNGKLNKNDTIQLIENMGGKSSETFEKKEQSVALVYEEEDREQTIVTWPFQGPPKIPCVTVNWFLDCLSTHTILDLNDYLFGKDPEESNQKEVGSNCVSEIGQESGNCDEDAADYVEDMADIQQLVKSDWRIATELQGNSSNEADVSGNTSNTELQETEQEETSNIDHEESDLNDADSDYVPETDSDFGSSDEDNEKCLEKDMVDMQHLKKSDWRNSTERQETEHDETSNEADVSGTSTVYPTITPKVVIQERFTTDGVKQLKYFSCLYCEMLVAKLPRHLERMHPFEDKVKLALQLPKKSNARRLAWLEIQQEGNYNHNYNVLSKGSGLLIPRYRSRENKKKAIEDYVPCEFCLGLYVKKDLWKHHNNCRKSRTDKDTNSARGKPITNGKLLLPSKAGVEVNEDILVKMRDDEIKAVITNDSTILEFANRMYEQNGHMQHRHQYIAQRLRELGRMLIGMKEKYASIDTIEKCLDPLHWEELIASVKCVAGFNPKTSRYSTPSFPLRVGQSLVKCAKLLKTGSIITSNEERRKKMDGFVELYESEWNARVASKCHNTLHIAKFNNPQLLPVTKDVQKLHSYLKQEAQKLCKVCKTDDYRRFAEICLAQIILFNRKRSGEAERIKLQDFKSSLLDTEVDEGIINSLTPLEKEIIMSHKRLEIVGKRGSKVPVILTDDMIQNLNCLLKIREEMNITSDFLFGKCNSQFPIRGSDALRNMAIESGASNPSLLTSTKLRKQLATLSQVLGLNEHGQDALAKFMGHDIRIHRNYYELPENTMQLARMSKVLHAVNEGKASAVSVQSLGDIDVTEEDIMMEEDSDSDVELDDSNQGKCNSHQKGISKEEINEGRGKSKCNAQVQRTLVPRKANRDNRKEQKGNRNKGPKSWTNAEQEAVLRHLGHHILSGKLPGKCQCEEVKRKEVTILQHRSWQQIKHFIRNRITSKNRKNNPVLLPYSFPKK